MGPDFYWVHTDHLATPLVATGALIDPIVVWRASYSAFGEARVEANPGGYGSIVLNYRLPGQYFDAEIGLHYNLLRTYDATTGRFLEADPVGQAGGLNVYLYATGDPTNFTDRFGLLGGADGSVGGLPSTDSGPGLWPGFSDVFRNPIDAILPRIFDGDLRLGESTSATVRCANRVRNQNFARYSDAQDALAHCVAAGQISEECSGGRLTARAAGLGDLATDLVNNIRHGNTPWLRFLSDEIVDHFAEKTGRRCSLLVDCEDVSDRVSALEKCCRRAGWM
jgi:RHS repeat-associated protein